jgi:flagellar biosynthesis protein FlhA
LVEDLVPKLLPVSVVQRVLQNLLEEQVHIRDMRSILEVLAAHAARTQDAAELTAEVRVVLGRAIAQQNFPGNSEMQVIALDPAIERLLMQAAATDSAVIEPTLAENLQRGVQAAARQQEQLGLPAVLLVPQPLRVLLSRFLRRSIPQLKVLSHGEVPDSRAIKVAAIAGSP